MGKNCSYPTSNPHLELPVKLLAGSRHKGDQPFAASTYDAMQDFKDEVILLCSDFGTSMHGQHVAWGPVTRNSSSPNFSTTAGKQSPLNPKSPNPRPLLPSSLHPFIPRCFHSDPTYKPPAGRVQAAR